MKPKKIDNPKDRKVEKDQFGKHVGDYLRKAREKKGISQEELSLEAGYYRTYVNKIEKGHYSPSMHTMWRLADALDMDLEEFFKDF